MKVINVTCPFYNYCTFLGVSGNPHDNNLNELTMRNVGIWIKIVLEKSSRIFNHPVIFVCVPALVTCYNQSPLCFKDLCMSGSVCFLLGGGMIHIMFRL